jgi:putative transposase
MTFSHDKHHRRSIRLQGYDYSQSGTYFVTICAKDRACLFGDIADGVMRLNDAGQIVQTTWDELPSHYPGVETDEFVVMPNHVHGIIVLTDRDVGAQFIAPLSNNQGAMNQGAMNRAPTLGAVVRGLKARVTAAVNGLRRTPGAPVWQRNYYEHIIRNDESLDQIRRYITDNPMQWALDRENPSAVGAQFIAPNDIAPNDIAPNDIAPNDIAPTWEAWRI